MRVVVTGGTGRAGRWVVRLLAEVGHAVVNFDLVSRPELEQIDVFDNNVLSAHNLMQAAGDLGVPRVVYASSEMATGLLTEGTAPTQIPFDETEGPRPASHHNGAHVSRRDEAAPLPRHRRALR
jgi:nucleoside-diphosphate-sugar epimerase